MRNILATVALAAVPALVMSACSGNGQGTGVSAVPNVPASTAGHHNRPLDTGADLEAGGATFPAFGYNLGSQPVGSGVSGTRPGPGAGSLFASYGGAGTIYYCLTGSGFGRKEFEANNGTATQACAALGATPVGFGARQDPLDFAGSDVAMASTECCTSGTTYFTGRLATSPSWGQPFEFPSIGGPIVYGYRQKDFKGHTPIMLSRWTYCAIANGTIGNWNDGAITADNGGSSVTGGKSEPITFYYRSDGSGTSYLYTFHLNAACNGSFGAPYNAPPYGSASRTAAWTFGFNQTWPGPTGPQASGSTFIGESGNPGVLASIQSTAFATGYVEGAWAASATGVKVLQAYLQDDAGTAFINPTMASAVTKALAKVTRGNITYGGGSDGNPLGGNRKYCQLYIDPSNWNFPRQQAGSYPIVGVSYLLFYGQNNGVHVADKTTLIKYIASPAANTIVKSLEYAPLNSGIHTAILNALNGSSSHKPCLQ
ncbi:MAG: substrate-binding domain-containing protein [Candidatus Cybelea sp.]